MHPVSVLYTLPLFSLHQFHLVWYDQWRLVAIKILLCCVVSCASDKLAHAIYNSYKWTEVVMFQY